MKDFHFSSAECDSTLAVKGGSSLALSNEERKELLKQLRAGEVVELEIDVKAFEQIDGSPNRNGLRFKNSTLRAMAKSGINTPFLVDHRQTDIHSRGGTVLSSTLVKQESGHHILFQTIKVTARWAVEGVLTGTIDRFSIGWRPEGDINCTSCKTSIDQCNHYPLELDEAGKTVEWEFSGAVLVETSGVTVPAVPSTQLGQIRAALASGNSAMSAPEERKSMSKAILGMLGLAATVGEDEIIKAVTTLKERAEKAEARAALQQENYSVLSERYAALEGQITSLSDQMKTRDKSQFLTEATMLKGVIPDSREANNLARMFDVDPSWARDSLAAMPRVTPVLAERQTQSTDIVTTHSVTADQVLRDHGYDPDIVRAQLAEMGEDPNKILNKRIGKGQ